MHYMLIYACGTGFALHQMPATSQDFAAMNASVIPFDQMTRFIRVRSEPDARFVEFDFAIGYPELFVELVLPHEAFKTFCQHNRVVQMNAAMCQAVDEDMAKWRFGDIGRRVASDRR